MPTATLHFSFSLFFLLVLFSGAKAGILDSALPEGDPERGGEKVAKQAGSKGLAGRVKIKPFERADIDRDHKLSFAEFVSVKRLQHMEADKRRKLFSYLDQNTDGFLQAEELHPPAPKWMKMASKSFSRFDQNKDGVLNIDEFSSLTGLLKMKKADPVNLFQRLDQNKNGFLEKAELETTLPRVKCSNVDFMTHDSDASGTIDYDEYSQALVVSKWSELRRRKLFQRIDADGDGELSKLELSAGVSGRRHSSDFMPPKKRRFPNDK